MTKSPGLVGGPPAGTVFPVQRGPPTPPRHSVYKILANVLIISWFSMIKSPRHYRDYISVLFPLSPPNQGGPNFTIPTLYSARLAALQMQALSIFHGIPTILAPSFDLHEFCRDSNNTHHNTSTPHTQNILTGHPRPITLASPSNSPPTSCPSPRRFNPPY